MLPPDQKGEPAEHLLLRETGLTGKEVPNAICEFLVVSHGDDRTQPAQLLALAPHCCDKTTPGYISLI